jgi:hypothetical protein
MVVANPSHRLALPFPESFAKTIIDILLEVDDIQKLVARAAGLIDLGTRPKASSEFLDDVTSGKESPTGSRGTHHVHAIGAAPAAVERSIWLFGTT